MPKAVGKIDLYARMFGLLKDDRMLVETQEIQSGPFIKYRDDILAGNTIEVEDLENMFNV